MSDKNQMLDDSDGERSADDLAPGAVDGKVVAMTPDEAAKLVGQRDADEEAFDDLLDPDDLSDLDDDDSEVLAAIEDAS